MRIRVLGGRGSVFSLGGLGERFGWECRGRGKKGLRSARRKGARVGIGGGVGLGGAGRKLVETADCEVGDSEA